MARKQYGIKYDEDLMARVDAHIESLGGSALTRVNRTTWIERAVERALIAEGGYQASSPRKADLPPERQASEQAPE